MFMCATPFAARRTEGFLAANGVPNCEPRAPGRPHDRNMTYSCHRDAGRYYKVSSHPAFSFPRSICMSQRVSFPCPSCRKQLAASARFVGRSNKCPQCGERVVVPPCLPEEAGPVLAWEEDDPVSALQLTGF